MIDGSGGGAVELLVGEGEVAARRGPATRRRAQRKEAWNRP